MYIYIYTLKWCSICGISARHNPLSSMVSERTFWFMEREVLLGAFRSSKQCPSSQIWLTMAHAGWLPHTILWILYLPFMIYATPVRPPTPKTDGGRAFVDAQLQPTASGHWRRMHNPCCILLLLAVAMPTLWCPTDPSEHGSSYPWRDEWMNEWRAKHYEHSKYVGETIQARERSLGDGI